MAEFFSFSDMETPEQRAERWGAAVLSGLRLTDQRGLLIKPRPHEIRAALYSALEALDDLDG